MTVFERHLSGYLAYRNAKSQAYYDQQGYSSPAPKHYVEYREKYAVVVSVQHDNLNNTMSVYIPLDADNRWHTAAGTLHKGAGRTPAKTTWGSIFDYPPSETLIPIYEPRKRQRKASTATIAKIIREATGIRCTVSGSYVVSVVLDDPTKTEREAIQHFIDKNSDAWDRSCWLFPPLDDCRDDDEISNKEAIAILDRLQGY